MHRRTFLGAVGGGLVLSGCVGDWNDNGGGTNESTSSATPTVTATATPRPTPSMGDVAHVVHWTDAAGDAVSHRVDGTAAETPTWLAYGATLPVHDGRVDAEYEVIVRDGRGNTAFTDATTTETTVTESKATVSDDKVGGIVPGTLSKGTYTVEVAVTDRVADVTGDPATISVAVVEPLGPDEVEITFDGSERVDGRTNLAMDLSVRNASDRDGGLVTGMSLKPAGAPDRHYRTFDATVGLDVPARVERHYRSEGWNFEAFENVDEVTFRFDAYDFAWTVPVR